MHVCALTLPQHQVRARSRFKHIRKILSTHNRDHILLYPGIARNLCRDHYRKSHRRRELLERNPVENGYHPGDFGDLHDALERLPEQHRLPLMLFYFDGKSTENLARELNLTKAGACTRLFRARNELRKLLGGEESAQ